MKKNQKQCGVFYVSNGRWVGPYMGMTYSKSFTKKNSFKEDIRFWKNYVLKSRVEIRPVG